MLLFYYNAKVKQTIQMTGIGTVVPALFMELPSGQKHASAALFHNFSNKAQVFQLKLRDVC